MFKISKYFLVGFFLFCVLLAPIFAAAQEDIYIVTEVNSGCSGVIITEIVPKPSGGTEWAELYNKNDYDINAKGCFFSDINGGHSYEIKEDLIIQSKEYYPFYSETSLSLNDTSGDGVRLLDIDGKTEKFKTAIYDKAEVGQSFALYNEDNNEWRWTVSLTPGSANVFASNSPVSEEIDEMEKGVHSRCDGIMITEIMPSPAGSDVDNEWIELYNSSSDTVDLSGCVLSDKLKAGSTKKYTIPTGTLIASGAYTKFMRSITKITLNNDYDGVVLLSSDGVLVSDTGLYTDAQESISYAYHEGQWFWTSSPTPEAANIISEPLLKSSKKISSTKKKAVSKPPKSTKNSAKKKTSGSGSEVLGASTENEGLGAQGRINDKMMGYVLVGLSTILLVGYVVWINKDFLLEHTIRKFKG